MILLAVKAIALITIFSGALQVVAPQVILGLIAAQVSTPITAHVFGIVGMFMVLFGGLTLHGLSGQEIQRVPLLWAALQKVGASIAVALGVAHGLFLPLSLAVAGFDLLSGVLAFLLLFRLKSPATRAFATR